MPIYALAMSARSILAFPDGYVSQVAVTVASDDVSAEEEGLRVVRENFPVSLGYSSHVCAAKEVPQGLVLAEASKLIGFDPEPFLEKGIE